MTHNVGSDARQPLEGEPRRLRGVAFGEGQGRVQYMA
jgi:hypothetical protein